MNVLILIPARYASTRFPGKPLAEIGGKPMIQHVVEKAQLVSQDAFVATDDQRIYDRVVGFGGLLPTTRAEPTVVAKPTGILWLITEKLMMLLSTYRETNPLFNPIRYVL